MNIIELPISDITEKNIDEFKVNLANEIISNMVPYINKEIIDKIKKLKELRNSLRSKRELILEQKNELENLLKTFDRKKKIKLLLDRALRLTTIGSLDDPNIRSEISVMLKVIDDLPEDKLDFYISEMMRIVSRRFSTMDNKE